MARLHNKPFRIESVRGAAAPDAALAEGEPAKAILSEIRALRSLIEPQEALSQRAIDAFRRELAEAEAMRAELEAVRDAIMRTKSEMASVHGSGFKGERMRRVTGELDAIVQGTLDATDAILTAAETIERDAHILEAAGRTAQDRQGASDIKEQVVRIYEACNFQDLTGQRITKVVGTLAFIEERIVRMMELWGGIEAFRSIELGQGAGGREDDASLLNGPRLAGDPGHASQDDIDALFN